MTRTAVCTNAQVLQTIGLNNEDEAGGTAVVTEAVEEAEIEVSGAWGDPVKKSTFVLDTDNTRYEFRNDDRKVFRVDRVIIREDDNTRRAYTGSSSASESSQNYIEDLEFNTVTFHADTVSTWDGYRVEIDYVPTFIHHLVRLKAALFLIDKTNVINAEENMPAVAIRLMNRIKRIEEANADAVAIGSTNAKDYDPTYGEVIKQRRFKTY